MTTNTETSIYRGLFEAVEQQTQPDWLRQQRQQAWARWEELGFPHRKNEDWRHTNLAPLKSANLSPRPDHGVRIGAELLCELGFGGLDASRIVLIDGVFRPDLSDVGELAGGTRVMPLRTAAAEDNPVVRDRLGRIAAWDNHPFSAMNTALWQDGVFVHLPRNVVAPRPVLLLHLSSGAPCTAQTRNLIVAESGSQVQVLSRYCALQDGAYFSNVVSEFAVGPNADVTHVKLQDESPEAFHLEYFQTRLDRDSRFSSYVAHTGGRLVRSDVRAWLGGENGNAVLDGLHLLHGRRHIDTNMWVDHAAPHCESHELYKSVLDDQSTSAFRGRIHVHRDAQKTDGYQSNQNLLLSRESTAWADPQLEIYADDVKCSHGATVGQLDDRALFYLRSRGVPKDAARALLVLAFAGEVLDAIQIEAVRERIRALVERRLPRTAPLA